MGRILTGKSQTPLQFRLFHTLVGFAVFFSLITVPGEAQVINLFGIATSSEFLWWPVVFYVLQVIHNIYGFAYLRQTTYLVIIFHAIYVLFLQLAIWLPASSFWQMQDTYTQVLGRDIFYLFKSSLLLWGSVLLPIWVTNPANKKTELVIFLSSLVAFSLLNMLWLNPPSAANDSQLLIPIFIYCFLNIFSPFVLKIIAKIEHKKPAPNLDRNLFKFQPPQNAENINSYFKYHHILFCSSIVFFIASKTMAAKFISIGFFTINVGGIVFSLAYLVADIMTDVYGIERTKQMVLFVIFCNLLFVFDVWITNLLAIGENNAFQLILHNQTRMFIASAVAFYLGMTINSTVMAIIKFRQKRRGISLKKEFITTVLIRIATSTAFGIIIDVSLFSLVAFYGIVPTEKLGGIIFYEDVYKISYEILLAPLSILLMYFLKVKEKVDIYDEVSNLNPFKINTDYKTSANKFNENYIQPKKKDDRRAYPAFHESNH